MPHTYIIFPFRDTSNHERLCQLYQTMFAIEKFDKKSHITYIVVEQNSKKCTKFNRGLLLNTGSLYAHDHAKRRGVCLDDIVIVHHDVDMCPVSNHCKISNTCNINVTECDIYNAYRTIPPFGKIIPLGQLWKNCPYYRNFNQFIGGVVVVSWRTMLAANGYPNNYWGWGGEEECFRFRLESISTFGDIFLRSDVLFGAEAKDYIIDLESLNMSYTIKYGRISIENIELYNTKSENLIPRPPRSEKNSKKWELAKDWLRDYQTRCNGLDDCNTIHNIYKIRPEKLPNEFMETLAVSGKLIWIVTDVNC